MAKGEKKKKKEERVDGEYKSILYYQCPITLNYLLSVLSKYRTNLFYMEVTFYQLWPGAQNGQETPGPLTYAAEALC